MVLQVMADDETPPRRYRRGNMALKGDAMLPGLKVGEGGLTRVDLRCVCNESLDAPSERARLWDCVPTDLDTLAGTGEVSVRLAELVGNALGDDVADLVRRRGGEGAQLLEGEKLLFGCQKIRVCMCICCGRKGRQGVLTVSSAFWRPAAFLWSCSLAAILTTFFVDRDGQKFANGKRISRGKR